MANEDKKDFNAMLMDSKDTTTHSIKDTVSAVKEKIASGTALLYCELDGRKSHNVVV